MPTTKPEDLNPDERKKMHEFLSAHPVGVLATVGPEGDPHASTIYFGVDEDLNITFTTKHDTNKYKNIAAHNKVMLVVFDAANQTAVQVSGSAEEVKDPEEINDIYHATLHAAKQTGEDIVPPIAKIAAGPYIGFKIKISNIWLSAYGWGDNFSNVLQHINDSMPNVDPA